MRLTDSKRIGVLSLRTIRSALSLHLDEFSARALRLALVLGVLATAVGLGILASKVNPVYALVAASAPLLLVGLQLVLSRFDLTPLIILFMAAFIPISLPTGTGSRLVASLLVTSGFVGLWLFRMLLVEKRFWLRPSPVNLPLLGFMIVTLLSLLWSNLFRDPFVSTWRSFPVVQVASAVVMIMLPGAFLLVAHHITHLKLVVYMVRLMLFAGIVGLIGRFAQINLPVNTEGLFAMWVISFAVGLALLNRQFTWWVRGGLLVLAAGWIYWGAGLNVSWLAGWLPGLVAVVVLSFRHSRKLVFASAALIVVLIILNLDYWRVVVEAESAESGVTRLAAWQLNWQITREHLLFGTGPAGYAAYYMAYFPTNAMATHSNYVDILAQTGVTGFALLIWFLIALVWQGYQLCQRVKGRGDFVEGLANAALAGTIGVVIMMGFGDWLFPFAYTQTIAGFDYAAYNWLFMGSILVIDRLTRAEADAIRHA